jgi:hypothetical protein
MWSVKVKIEPGVRAAIGAAVGISVQAGRPVQRRGPRPVQRPGRRPVQRPGPASHGPSVGPRRPEPARRNRNQPREQQHCQGHAWAQYSREFVQPFEWSRPGFGPPPAAPGSRFAGRAGAATSAVVGAGPTAAGSAGEFPSPSTVGRPAHAARQWAGSASSTCSAALWRFTPPACARLAVQQPRGCVAFVAPPRVAGFSPMDPSFALCNG